jgi:hypothetical protein
MPILLRASSDKLPVTASSGKRRVAGCLPTPTIVGWYFVTAILFSLSSWFEPALAQGRSADAWSSFKIWRVYGGHSVADASSCLYESYGAVINGCTYNVGLTFDLTLDSSVVNNGSTYLTAYVNIVANPKNLSKTATCSLNAFGQPGSSVGWTSSGPVVVAYTGAGQLNVSSATSIYAAGIYCDNIPPGLGIGWVQWTRN